MGLLNTLYLPSLLCLCLLPYWAQCGELDRRPVLHKPQGSPGTGCYFVVLEEKTPEEQMQQLMAAISKLADDSRIHSMVKKVSKAFTVKLSSYALELVAKHFFFQSETIICCVLNFARSGECRVWRT